MFPLRSQGSTFVVLNRIIAVVMGEYTGIKLFCASIGSAVSG